MTILLFIEVLQCREVLRCCELFVSGIAAPTKRRDFCYCRRNRAFSLLSRKSKAFCERAFAVNRQQCENDKENVEVIPGKFSANAHGWQAGPDYLSAVFRVLASGLTSAKFPTLAQISSYPTAPDQSFKVVLQIKAMCRDSSSIQQQKHTCFFWALQ